MSHETNKYDLGDLLQQLSAATKALADAEREESAARSITTNARNNLNAVQKAIDGLMSELRKRAPRDSKWADELRPPAAV